MKGRTRTLEVVHSGMVLISDGKGHGNPARLILTKEQLLVQINDKGSIDGSNTNLGPIADLQPELTVNTLRSVTIEKGKEGLGLSIKGGSEGGNNVPVVISKVIPNTPAAKTNRLFVGDAIVEINGASVDAKTHDEVVQMLRETSSSQVTLTVRGETVLGPLLRRSSSKRLSGSTPDSTLELSVKPVLKASSTDRYSRQSVLSKDDEIATASWKTINRLPLPMAIVSRYLWGTDKLRNNAFEVRTVDGKSSGIIHCEDLTALEQWIKHLESNINTLNKKSIKMSNKYLHPSEHISYIGWIEERMPDGYFEDPKMHWEQRFVIFKGADLCIFESPPLDSEELDKCVCLYKVYETTLMTAIKHLDRREHVFALDTNLAQLHYFSMQSVSQLQQLESAYYNCVYKSVSSLQSRTFACSHEGRPAGFVFDIKQGISLYDIPTKRYAWQYGFHDMESSSDDGKMRLQLIFRDESQQGGVQHLTK
uniref:PDZ domain-containing protein n=1 Tax=Acrobeloides nanus TaxID=290746 RepID=A0A914CEL2_9BILA